MDLPTGSGVGSELDPRNVSDGLDVSSVNVVKTLLLNSLVAEGDTRAKTSMWLSQNVVTLALFYTCWSGAASNCLGFVRFVQNWYLSNIHDPIM